MTGFAPLLGSTDAYTFFGGVVGADSEWMPYTVKLGGQTYIVDLTNYKHSAQETLRDSAALGTEPSDALFNAAGAWARYRYSWHHGADQEIADFDDEDADLFRFESSVGVDVWSKNQLTLLPDTRVAKALTTAGNQVLVTNGRIYVSDGADLYYSSDLTNWTTATAPGGTIQSLATDGSDLYCATSTVMKKYATGAPGTAVAFGTAVTGNCTLVAFVANRLLLAKANVLYEVGSTGTLTTVDTHYQSAFRWTTVFAIGSRIYCGGYAGQRSELYTYNVDSGGALVRSVEAAPLPYGELLRGGAANAGIALLCTSNGVRMAQVGADGTLTYGALIDATGDTSAVAFDDRFAWVGWTAHPSTGRGTARLALDTTVAPLQPAYASDVFTAASGTVTGIARFNDETCFIVDGAGLYRHATTYVEEGWVESGRLFFGTVEPKAITELAVVCEPLDSDEAVLGSVYAEDDSHLGTGIQNLIGSTGFRFGLDSTQVRWARVRVTLRGNGDTSPLVLHWRLRAFPIPPVVLQWIVPLIVFSRTLIGGGMGQELTYSVLDEAERVRGWCETKEQVTYQEGDRAYKVRVDAFEIVPQNWNDEGAYFEHTLVVKLVSA